MLRIALLVSFLGMALLSACSPRSDQNQLQNTSSSLFSKCENTFIVSGSRKLYLFEHRPKSTEFNQLAVFDDWAPLSPFLDCDNNRIVIPYGARKADRSNAGIAIIDLESGAKNEYPINARGIQGIPLKYDNGLLLSTTLLKQTNPLEMPPTYGYSPPGESYKDSNNTSFRLFSPTAYFDLDHLHFTKDLDLDLGYSVIQNHTLYSKQRGAITAIDLAAKTTDVLYEFKATQFSEDKDIPFNHLGVFLDSDYFMVLNRHSHNNPNGTLEGFEKNAIYKLVDGAMQKLTNYPGEDAVYLLGLDKKLYIFTHSLKVFEYNFETNALVEQKLPKFNDLKGYSIESVGYTQQNFIITFDNYQTDINSIVVLMSRDFKRISQSTSVDLRLISVTSELAIDTSDIRGMQLSENQNALLK
ncbi:MAG: hypothetical protein P8I13_06460 [Porticoccaceae bacterium]|nr:hypothetical protein [Porticoccaceae bacterium]